MEGVNVGYGRTGPKLPVVRFADEGEENRRECCENERRSGVNNLANRNEIRNRREDEGVYESAKEGGDQAHNDRDPNPTYEP